MTWPQSLISQDTIPQLQIYVNAHDLTEHSRRVKVKDCGLSYDFICIKISGSCLRSHRCSTSTDDPTLLISHYLLQPSHHVWHQPLCSPCAAKDLHKRWLGAQPSEVDCGWNGSKSAQLGHSHVSTHPVQLQAFRPVKASLDFCLEKKKSVAFCGGLTRSSVSKPSEFPEQTGQKWRARLNHSVGNDRRNKYYGL